MKHLIAFMLMLMVAVPSPGPAQQPLTSDAAIERAWLFKALETAPTEETATAIANQIWRFWFRQGPNQEANRIMAKAMERRDARDFAGAIEQLDTLVEIAPDWAEAWNQRATVLFFQEKDDNSLDDVEKVLELEPKHFGALAGKAVILMRQGRMQLAQQALRRAVDIHPWLKERGMLLPEPPGQKL
ncbi:MAG TPA: tetratricopeptide repeat protein [Thermohalobaculum sp.]|nr:tetratricopeptide repeat protein [Thermohalobaculum sp.]